jgi:GTP-binding protein
VVWPQLFNQQGATLLATQDIRNVAVIAHVDHGKTTLIDAFLKQSHVFRDNEEEMQETCILDSTDLEREKGITILAKNVAIFHRGVKINIIDTPGHADFSGEVERTLGMADGALLIIDALEGPMPQTRFVLRKAIELNLKIIVVINKIDRPFANVTEAIEKTNDLFLELATEAHHLDFATLFAVGRDGKAFADMPPDYTVEGDVAPLLDAIIAHVPPPPNSVEGDFKMVISTLDYNPHIGRILIGKVHRGTVSPGLRVNLTHDPEHIFTIETVFVSQGLSRKQVDKAEAGDIVGLTGVDEGNIGQTVAVVGDYESLPTISISEPTLQIDIGPNTSPFAGRDGKASTGRQLEERLLRELETNLSLRLAKLPNARLRVSGRGELHLAILLETLRREGHELEVSRPEVITKTVNHVTQEPYEEVSINVHNEHEGVIIQELGKRQGQLITMSPLSVKETSFTYKMPTRATIGLRGVLLTATRGTVEFSSQVVGYEPMGGALPRSRQGVLVSSETGPASTFGLNVAQGRGATFIEPGTDVYEGMIIGLHSRENDLKINVVKGKKLTNIRSSTSDIAVQLDPPITYSLEQSLGMIENDELLEITPLSLRMRKKVLSADERYRLARDDR